MSAADHREFLYINEKDTPQCFKIYMKHPVEFTEAWVNMLMGRQLDHDVISSVDEIFHDVLFEKIAEATLADEVAIKNEATPSGLEALREHIRDDKMSKFEQIKLTLKKQEYISKRAESNNGEGVSGCQILNDEIPLAAATEARDLYRESQNTLLNCRPGKKGEDLCRVRIAMLMQIEKVEK